MQPIDTLKLRQLKELMNRPDYYQPEIFNYVKKGFEELFPPEKDSEHASIARFQTVEEALNQRNRPSENPLQSGSHRVHVDGYAREQEGQRVEVKSHYRSLPGEGGESPSPYSDGRFNNLQASMASQSGEGSSVHFDKSLLNPQKSNWTQVADNGKASTNDDLYSVKQKKNGTKYRFAREEEMPTINMINMMAPVSNPIIRGLDDYGSGHYLAGRGDYNHTGGDYVARLGEPIKSPFNGTVTDVGRPYGDTTYTDSKGKSVKYRSVEVEDEKTGHRTNLMYVSPKVKKDDVVKQGDLLGHVQDLSIKFPKNASHPKGIVNHIHMELYKEGKDGVRVYLDPTKYIKPKE